LSCSKTILKPLIWLGDSLKNLKEFPDAVQKDIGDALQVVQWGAMPGNTKPLKGIGSGIYEIIQRYDTNTYRAVYALKLGEKVYILHAFQKKSTTGIKTPQQDIDTIKRRYREAIEREQE
jgi:phage-related protein